MSTLYGVTLLLKGETKKTKLKEVKDKNPLTLESLQAIVKKKTPIEELGTYKNGALRLTLFGYTTGKAGTENKHDLPPPLNEVEYFGDILLVAWKEGTSWTTPVNFTPDEYEKFYQKALTGEDDDDDDDEDDDDEDDEDEEEKNLEEELEEEVHGAVKKKAAEEDGEPEDEEDDEEEEEDELEEEEEDELVLDEEVDVEGDAEGPVVQQKKAAAKKKPSKTTSASQNTGRYRQQQICKRLGLQDVDTLRPVVETSGQEKECRTHAIQVLTKQLGSQLSRADIERLESSILQIAYEDGNKKHVTRNFENPLFRIIYLIVLRRVVGNLNPASYVGNTGLLPKLLSKDLTIETLATMNVMDYSPQLYAGLRERMLLREKQQLEGNKAMATDMFKCGRCHKRETTFYELQTRSADEPMTKFITCVNCGNHWRM